MLSTSPVYRASVAETSCATVDLTFSGVPTYLEACMEESDGDAAFIAKALGDIARAQGMTQVARESGLARESLYMALSGERRPSFSTTLKVVSALGLKLSASVRSKAKVT